MCTNPLKKPKIKKVEEKPVQFLRNPFLDAIGIGQDTGRNSLRIDLAGPSAPLAFEGGRAATSPATAKSTQGAIGGIPSFAPGLFLPTRSRTSGRTQPF